MRSHSRWEAGFDIKAHKNFAIRVAQLDYLGARGGHKLEVAFDTRPESSSAWAIGS